MEEHLQQHKLDSEKFIKILHQLSIYTVENIQSQKQDKEICKKILEKADNPIETENLKLLLGMDNDSSQRKESLEETGLDSEYNSFVIIDDNASQTKNVLQRCDTLEFFSDVKEFTNDNFFAENCVTYLRQIVEVKNNMSTIMESNELWKSNLNSQSEIAKFLKTVFQHRDDFSKNDIAYIMYYVSSILDDANAMDFKEKLLEWIRSRNFSTDGTSSNLINFDLLVTDMGSFISEIHHSIIPNIKKAYEDYGANIDEDNLTNAIVGFLVLINSFMGVLQNGKDHHQVSFLKLMLLPLKYDDKRKYFNINISVEMVEKFYKHLLEENARFMHFKEEGKMQVETYLVSLIHNQIVTETLEAISIDSRFLEILESIKVSKETSTFLEKYVQQPIDWKMLIKVLEKKKHGLKMVEERLGSRFWKSVFQAEFTDIKPSDDKGQCADEKDLDENKEEIIHKLGLKSFYPPNQAKLTLSDIRKRPMSVVKKLVDVPWYLLERILLMDYRGLNDLQFPIDECKPPDSNISTSKESKRKNMLSIIKMQLQNVSSKTCLNPMDVLVAVFLCADDFLKRLLVQKMAMCRLSIPFILPNIYNECILQLWSLRGITLERYGKSKTIVDHRIPIVSVIRLGKLPRSKSILLNYILNYPYHNTFFNKDCGHGKEKRVLSQGLVDTTWYIPSGKNTCLCNDQNKCKCYLKTMSMFLNLHGSCDNFKNQLKFLCNVSNVVILFMDVDHLLNCEKSIFFDIVTTAKKHLLVLTKKEHCEVGDFSEDLLDLYEEIPGHSTELELLIDYDEEQNRKTLGVIKADIISKINKLLDPRGEFTSLQELKENNVLGIKTDEDDQFCKYGKQQANKVSSILDKDDMKEAKKTFLMLQGDLWKDWGCVRKREKRIPTDEQSLDHYVGRLSQEQKELRREQLDMLSKPNKLMEMFLLNMIYLKQYSRLYFIHQLRNNLDEISINTMPSIRKEYSEIWSKIQINKAENKTDVKELQCKLKNVGKTLEESSFSLEHLFREIGQIYEAIKELEEEVVPELTRNIDIFPKIMAELLLCGYPIEIMDGNASHVPIKWIQAVFKQLETLIESKEIFVLSVLGIQSSGKSTLLNTMFGLQFSVSAGRCTVGVFAQLVPLPKNHSSRFDYIMVVDTEGLRAQELGLKTHKNDNEIATLAIGIADLTIINIKGENQSDIQDVLQIVTHAFIRMQMVNNDIQLNASCFFVHQNVGAADANERLKVGQKKFLEHLDEMAKVVATSQGINDVNSFSDIIAFNVESDVFNFSDLWLGNPPMAPVNYGYSDNVSLVKKRIFDITIPKAKSGLNISKLSIRLCQLWEGIMSDNFVFSFKNSLELNAFNSLELTCNNLSWKLTDAGLKWFNANKQIIQITPKSTLEESLSTCVNSAYKDAKNALEEHFKCDEAEILAQWKERTERELLSIKKSIISKYKDQIHVEIEARKENAKLTKHFHMWTKEISAETTKLAIELKGKHLSDEELTEHFDRLWITWFTKLQLNRDETLLKLAVNVSGVVEEELKRVCQSDESLFFTNELSEQTITYPVQNLIEEFQLRKAHVVIKKKWMKNVCSFTECQRKATFEMKSIFKILITLVEDCNGQRFCSDHPSKILKYLTDFIKEFNEDDSKDFTFTPLYKMYILIYTCRFSIPKFKEMHEAYKKKVDPSIQEEIYRKQLKTKFIDVYNERAAERTYANVISIYLEGLITSKVDDDLPRILANNVRDNHPFMHSKSKLQNEVLIEYVNNNSFNDFILYIKNTTECLKKKLLNDTNTHLFKKGHSSETKYFDLVKTKLESEVTRIVDKIKDLPTEVKKIGNNVDIQYWVDCFVKVMNTLPIFKENLQDIIKEEFKTFDFGNFHSILIDNLRATQEKLINKYKKDIILPKEVRKIVNCHLADSCVGCTEQCPFCFSPCSLTQVNHECEHSSIHHYPEGVSGTIWITGPLINTLVITNCCSQLANNNGFKNSKTADKFKKYVKYKDIYPTWSITADASLDASLVWKWFMSEHINELVQLYNAKMPNIPKRWKQITKKEVTDSLNDVQ